MKMRSMMLSALALLASGLMTVEAQGQICSSPLTPAQRLNKVKFFPGHYVAVTGAWNAAEDTFKEIQGNPNIIGIQKRYFWSNLQTGPTTFDFTKLTNDLSLAAKYGKKISVMIMWKFMANGGISPVPSYVDNLTTAPIHYRLGGIGYGAAANGYLTALDNPVVATEFIKFLRKLSEVVDNRNEVANIVFVETSMGTSKESLEDAFNRTLTNTDVTAIQNRYIDGVIRVDQQATCAFKHTPVLQLTNFPITRLKDMTESHKKWSVSMGGPDVWLNDPSIERTSTTQAMRAYDYYPLLEEALPIGVIIAGGNYRYENHDPETITDAAERATYTMEALYGWTPDKVTYELGSKAIDQLGANYIFWKRDSPDDKYYQAFRRHAAKIGTTGQTIKPTPTACPTNYAKICVKSL